MRIANVLTIGVVLCGFVVSCGDDDDDFDDGQTAAVDSAYAVYGTDAATWDTASVYAATDPLDDPFFAQRTANAEQSSELDPDEAAAAAVVAADQYFTPASCVDASADGGDVTYELDSCKGPLGIRRASGTIHVKFSRPADDDEDAGLGAVDAGVEEAQLAFDVSSEGLTIDGLPAVLDASGVYTRLESGDKQVVMHSQGQSTRDANMVSRDVTSNAHWAAGSQCVEIDSSGTLMVLGRTLTINVEDFTRCDDECPQSGTVEVVGARTVTLTLDGTDQPDFASSNGTTGNIDLQCGK